MILQQLKSKSYAWSFLSLAIIWLLLTGNDIYSWLLGVPAVVLGLLSRQLLPKLTSFRVAIHHVPQFLVFFLYQSCHGGIDVAMRTLTNNLSPGLLTYRFQLSNKMARVFFANIVSLLPGTLSAELLDDSVVIHVLDERMANEKELQKLERKVALVFREEVAHD